MDFHNEDDAVVIDAGSLNFRAGLAGEEVPLLTCDSSIFSKSSAEQGQATYVGKGCSSPAGDFDWPIERGIVHDWESMQALLEYTYRYLNVEPESRPVLVSEPVLYPSAASEQMAQVLFESINVRSMQRCVQPILNHYAYGHTSGINLLCGHGVTQVMGVYEGYTPISSINRQDFGGSDLMSYMCLLLRNKGLNLCGKKETKLVRDIVENVCHFDESQPSKKYTLPDGSKLDLTEEAQNCSEAIFQPSLMNSPAVGLHDLIASCISSCERDIQRDWFPNVITVGGISCVPGLTSRLHKELSAKFQRRVKIKPGTRDDGEILNSVWIGGSILASLTTMQQLFITRAEYDDVGPNAIYRKFASPPQMH